MGIHIEKIYYLENPESGMKKIASESEVKFENVIKDVFGVAFLEDLSKMIRYNKKFQEYICKANNVNEKEITMELVFRLASKEDLLPLKAHYNEIKENDSSSNVNENQVFSVSPPFNSTIRLDEGVFNWNEKESCYVKTN